jgi:predicted dehydrogenase
MKLLKVGILGLDSSHATAFASKLNDPTAPGHVPGGEVIAAFPAGSLDMPVSIGRVGGITQVVRKMFGVEILDSPAAVAERVDAIMITASDGRAHLPLFREVARFGRPTFIDKPLATSGRDAQEIFRLADESGSDLVSCSSLRYADPLVDALASEDAAANPIVGCELSGPMSLEPTTPRYFWYGVHTFEMMMAIMKPGCESVFVEVSEKLDVVTARWKDGRTATIHGRRSSDTPFGKEPFVAKIRRERGEQLCECSKVKRSPFECLLEALMDRWTGGQAGRLWRATAVGSVGHNRASRVVDPTREATLEIMRMLDAAGESAETGRMVAV